MTRETMAGVALMAVLAGPAGAAEPAHGPISAAVARLGEIGRDEAPVLGTIKLDGGWAEPATARRQSPPHVGELNRPKSRRVGRAIAGAAVGAVGGAFAGGYLGAAIDGDCGGCDDPGFKGFLIGFPVGGVVGGVLGGLFLFR